MAQWHEAFRIYGAIYFEKYPTESPKLMKYAAIIANLAEKAGIEAAFFYDQAYRQWREVDPLHLPWDGVNGRGALIQKNSPVNRNLKPGDFQISTPIHIDQLGKYLKGYDTRKVEFLLEGFKTGFKIPFEGAEKYQFSRNLKSTLENCLVLKKKITEEIKAGRVAGPFKEPPFENFRISPLGLVPKSKPGEFRVIHDLSHPLGSSVNDGISKENSAVQYQSVDDACQLMLKYGKNCVVSKIDVVQAYRFVPMHFSCYHLLGFALEEGLYFD
ncbi:Hypothetical predicted protein [Mytilus galloprovincialis]|uniref:Reverse transcriptase domain-containing protein n=1 Tax=Mytilus galloprovincialis TaxID=29158 RepID=A0A8B6FW75_MYTGA|nr:Hypothetical predicted protein [Mytilus galloprovincialis]